MTRQTPRVLRAWDSVTIESASTAAATASRASSVASTPDRVEIMASWLSTRARNFGSASGGNRSAAVRRDSMAPGAHQAGQPLPTLGPAMDDVGDGGVVRCLGQSLLGEGERAFDLPGVPGGRRRPIQQGQVGSTGQHSGSATRSHSSRARSYIFSASKCADDPASRRRQRPAERLVPLVRGGPVMGDLDEAVPGGQLGLLLQHRGESGVQPGVLAPAACPRG